MNPLNNPTSNMSQGQQNSLAFLNAPAPVDNTSQPNFLEKLLPMGVGILGGLVGGGVSDGLGTIAGASVGSGLGQGLEDMITGKKSDVGDIGTAALEGGVGQLTGMGAGKALGAIGGGLGNMAAKGAEKKAGDVLTSDLAGLTDKEIINNKVGSGTQALTEMGVTPSAQTLSSVPAAVTEHLNNHINDVLKPLGGVDLSPAGLRIANLDPATQSLLNTSGVEGSFSANTAPDIARKLLTSTQAAEAGAKPVIQTAGQAIDPAAQMKYNQLKDVVNELKTAIYKRPGVDEAFAASKGSATPESVMASSPNVTAEEAPLVAAHINSLIDNAKSGQEILTPFSKNIALGQAGDKAVLANQELGPIRPESMPGEAPIVSEGAVAAGSLLHPGVGAGLRLGNKLGNSAVAGASNLVNKVNPNVLNLLSQLATHTPSMGSSAAPATAVPGETNVNPYQTTGMPAPDLSHAMMQAGIVDPAMLPMLQQAQQQGLKGQVASGQLGGLETAYNNAGGAQGGGSGLLSQLSGMIPGSAAYQYNQQKNSVGTAIAQALGLNPAQVTQMLPSLMADPAGAQNLLAQLQGDIRTMGAPAAQYQNSFGAIPTTAPSSNGVLSAMPQ